MIHFPNICRILQITAFTIVSITTVQADNSLTLTTKTDQGGFDGWCSVFWAGSSNDFGPDITGERLNVGNLRPTAHDRSTTYLMFGLSPLQNINPEDIESAILSYYVIEAYGSPVITITHGLKEKPELVPGKDNLLKAADNNWTSIGVTHAKGKTQASIDVTNSLLADLRSSNAYSSYRLIQAETFGSKQKTFPYGSRIASSENTSGHPVPTLTIKTRSPDKP